MPDLFAFLDYRKYLDAYYTEQKARNKAFSFQSMAWKAGFRSKSFFKEVISGKKNISPASVFSVAKALGLQGEAFSYFEALVAFNQARTVAEKEHWFRQASGFRKRGKSSLVAANRFEFYSEWYHNSVRELVTWFDFKEDYARLGRRLKPAIGAAQARASVRLLLKLGLIVKDGKCYRQTDPAITTGEEVLSAAVGSFHLKNMGLAAASLDAVPGAERDISCLVAGLSPRGFAKVKAEIQDFRKKLIELIRNDDPASRVYHINFQLFPTSEGPDA
ncbi:MAG TPA: TIGR02147 family protein [Fibrobacteria bacterium]|nr:TIGR02147 family protein [Fibrobacteria bacterium]